MSYAKHKQVAVEAVRRASKLCLAVQADMVNVDSLEKGDKSPVTVADFGAQAVVCQHVTANFPDVIIVGEEDSADQLEPILAHEIVHLRRLDTLAATLQVVSQILWWFHPLVWWANRRLLRGCRKRSGCPVELVHQKIDTTQQRIQSFGKCNREARR